MPLIKHGSPVEDAWLTAADVADLERAGDLIVPLALWREAGDRLSAQGGRLGLRLANGDNPAEIAGELHRFALIALEFPKFTDGRAFSQARLLRERFGFAGELRAVGHVLVDQLGFMLRCGFDAFEVADARALDNWARATARFSAWYQPAGDAATPIPAQRLQRRPVRIATPRAEPALAANWAY